MGEMSFNALRVLARESLACCASACVTTLLTAPATSAAGRPLSSTPDAQPWVTNGVVRAIAIAPDGTTYIGGDFTYVGPNTGSGAALDASSGAVNLRSRWSMDP